MGGRKGYIKHHSNNFVRHKTKNDQVQMALEEGRRRAELSEAERLAEAKRSITLPRVKWLERPWPEEARAKREA